MEHTQIVTATQLEAYAETIESESVIPELLWMLIQELRPDLNACRIPYGDSSNEKGHDGIVDTKQGFPPFVPPGKSFWEIGTGRTPQTKATKDFNKRTRETPQGVRQDTAFVFVTPRSGGTGGWNEPAQTKWVGRMKKFSWGRINILDGIQIADWLREYPAIGKWLLKRMGYINKISGFRTPTEHWENLQYLSQKNADPPLPAKLFLIGREQACTELTKLFTGELRLLQFVAESENDSEDFVAAFLASLDENTRRSFSNRCLFIGEADAWASMSNLKSPHVFIAHPTLDLEGSGEQLYLAASKKGHGLVIPISGASARGSENLLHLRNPSASMIERVLAESGYARDRARQLADVGALNLAGLKRNLGGLGELPAYASWENARLLVQAALIGRWHGENAADKRAMEILLGKSYGEWIETVRPETLRSDTPLIQRNENWKIVSRSEAWSALGPQISNNDLDLFQKFAIEVLRERDPKFELPPDDRFAASIYGKGLNHSASIRQGVAETLALLGSRPNALISCSHGNAEHVADFVVRKLLKGADWAAWASLNSLLPMLAEAAPDEFLDNVEGALLDPSQSPFNGLFAQEGSGIMGGNYTSGLLWALETLAWHPDYLQRVTLLLGELAAIDPGGNWTNPPANSLIFIFLPWYPQTCASIEKRKSAVEALLKEQPNVGWKLLLSLLPQMHGSSMGSRKPVWRQLLPTGWSNSVTNRDYWEQATGYTDLAFRIAKTDSGKLAEMIDLLPNLPGPGRESLLDHFNSEAILNLPELSRLPIWEALIDLSRRHRKFPDAKWVMPEESLSKIEKVASALEPKSLELRHRRLFSSRDFDLFDEKGNYEEQQKKLNHLRETAVQEIVQMNGMEGLLDFAKQVTNPGMVGLALGNIDWQSAEATLLPNFLIKEDKTSRDFVAYFIWGRFWKMGWSWADATISENWTEGQKAAYLTFLPFSSETWRRADSILGDGAASYWKNVNVQPYGTQPNLLEAAQKLLHYERPLAALACLDRLIHENVDFPPALAEQALLDGLKTAEPSKNLDQYAMREMIKWLQSRSDANSDALFRIEWSYLPLLDHEDGGEPKTLEIRMSTDPSFFCEVIALAYRSDKEEHKERKFTDSEKKIIQNVHRLLHGWQTVPGTIEGKAFEGVAFGGWLEEVSRRTKESGHYHVALNVIGQVLPYSPPDPDGLWIHRAVAEVLNAKDAADMRSGFTSKRFNMRGAYWFSSGKQELEIASGFHKQAEALEAKGYHRFATAIRELAKTYEREAGREAKRDPFEE